MNGVIQRIRTIADKLLHPSRYYQRLYPYTYISDGLSTVHNCDFLEDERFRAAYACAKETGSWFGNDLLWRSYIVFWYADLVKHLEGDFVECGVNKGGFSRGLIEYIDFKETGKTFYLFDTFTGFDERYVSEQEKDDSMYPIYAGHYQDDCYEEVTRTFEGFNVQIVKGAVPETLSKVDIGQVAFLSIDMNCVAPEEAALEFFWERLVPGAVVILDDYGFPHHEAQKKAHDAFAGRQGVAVLSLPTGQGILMKPYAQSGSPS